MCLNNTKELELFNSRKGKTMPDPLCSRLEFTRNTNSCAGPAQGSAQLVISWMHRGRNHVCVYAPMHIYVCMYIHAHARVCQTVLRGAQRQDRGNSHRLQEGKFELDIRKNSSHLGGLSTQLGKGLSDLTQDGLAFWGLNMITSRGVFQPELF